MWVQSLHQKDPLEKHMATHSSILAWRIPWTEAGYSPQGHEELDMTEVTQHLSYTKFMFLDTKEKQFFATLSNFVYNKIAFSYLDVLTQYHLVAAKNISGKEKTNSQFLKFQLQSQEGDAKSQKYYLYGVMCAQWFEFPGELALKCLVMLPMPRVSPLFIKKCFLRNFIQP